MDLHFHSIGSNPRYILDALGYSRVPLINRNEIERALIPSPLIFCARDFGFSLSSSLTTTKPLAGIDRWSNTSVIKRPNNNYITDSNVDPKSHCFRNLKLCSRLRTINRVLRLNALEAQWGSTATMISKQQKPLEALSYFLVNNCPLTIAGPLIFHRLDLERILLCLLEEAIIVFNSSEIPVVKAIDQIIRLTGIVKHDPLDIALFLLLTEGLSSQRIGEYLGSKGEYCELVLKMYLSCLSFDYLEPDVALRFFLSRFLLFGESQVIYRILEQFAERYVQCKKVSIEQWNGVKQNLSPDVILSLCYTILMLNTSLHKRDLPRTERMSQSTFLAVCSYSKLQFSSTYLQCVFQRISNSELAVDEDRLKIALFYKNLLTKCITHQEIENHYDVLQRERRFFTDLPFPLPFFPVSSMTVATAWNAAAFTTAEHAKIDNDKLNKKDPLKERNLFFVSKDIKYEDTTTTSSLSNFVNGNTFRCKGYCSDCLQEGTTFRTPSVRCKGMLSTKKDFLQIFWIDFNKSCPNICWAQPTAVLLNSPLNNYHRVTDFYQSLLCKAGLRHDSHIQKQKHKHTMKILRSKFIKNPLTTTTTISPKRRSSVSTRVSQCSVSSSVRSSSTPSQRQTVSISLSPSARTEEDNNNTHHTSHPRRLSVSLKNDHLSHLKKSVPYYFTNNKDEPIASSSSSSSSGAVVNKTGQFLLFPFLYWTRKISGISNNNTHQPSSSTTTKDQQQQSCLMLHLPENDTTSSNLSNLNNEKTEEYSNHQSNASKNCRITQHNIELSSSVNNDNHLLQQDDENSLISTFHTVNNNPIRNNSVSTTTSIKLLENAKIYNFPKKKKNVFMLNLKEKKQLLNKTTANDLLKKSTHQLLIHSLHLEDIADILLVHSKNKKDIFLSECILEDDIKASAYKWCCCHHHHHCSSLNQHHNAKSIPKILFFRKGLKKKKKSILITFGSKKKNSCSCFVNNNTYSGKRILTSSSLLSEFSSSAAVHNRNQHCLFSSSSSYPPKKILNFAFIEEIEEFHIISYCGFEASFKISPLEKIRFLNILCFFSEYFALRLLSRAPTTTTTTTTTSKHNYGTNDTTTTTLSFADIFTEWDDNWHLIQNQSFSELSSVPVKQRVPSFSPLKTTTHTISNQTLLSNPLQTLKNNNTPFQEDTMTTTTTSPKLLSSSLQSPLATTFQKYCRILKPTSLHKTFITPCAILDAAIEWSYETWQFKNIELHIKEDLFCECVPDPIQFLCINNPMYFVKKNEMHLIKKYFPTSSLSDLQKTDNTLNLNYIPTSSNSLKLPLSFPVESEHTKKQITPNVIYRTLPQQRYLVLSSQLAYLWIAGYLNSSLRKIIWWKLLKESTYYTSPPEFTSIQHIVHRFLAEGVNTKLPFCNASQKLRLNAFLVHQKVFWEHALEQHNFLMFTYNLHHYEKSSNATKHSVPLSSDFVKPICLLDSLLHQDTISSEPCIVVRSLSSTSTTSSSSDLSISSPRLVSSSCLHRFSTPSPEIIAAIHLPLCKKTNNSNDKNVPYGSDKKIFIEEDNKNHRTMERSPSLVLVSTCDSVLGPEEDIWCSKSSSHRVSVVGNEEQEEEMRQKINLQHQYLCSNNNFSNADWIHVHCDIISEIIQGHAFISPTIGFISGQEYLISYLLTMYSPADTFHMLTRLSLSHGFEYFHEFASVYSKSEQALISRYCLFDELLQTHIPSVAKHFTSLGLDSRFFLFDWECSLFCKSCIPLNLLSRHLDLVFLFGEAALFSIALMLVSQIQTVLIEKGVRGCFQALLTRCSTEVKNCFNNEEANKKKLQELWVAPDFFYRRVRSSR